MANAGNYEVYAHWTSGGNRANNVPIDVTHGNGTTTVTVDQTQNGGQWNLLGVFHFDAGTSGNVRIRNGGTNLYVIADAIRLVAAAPDTTAPTATLADPANSGSIVGPTLNSRGYIDVTFSDDVALDAATITDAETEFTLSGAAAAGVSVDGAATLVSGNTYRYGFSGSFGSGTVSVDFTNGTWADDSGNNNAASSASFDVAFDRASIDVLLIQDENTNGEFEDDVPFINDVLVGLGYSVTFSHEADLPSGGVNDLADYFATFDVVMLSNPGYPYNDALTVDALKMAMDQGVGVILQGDDAISSTAAFPAVESVKAISGLQAVDPANGGFGIDNGDPAVDPFYTVDVGTGHSVQAGIESEVFLYADDIDTTESIGAEILAVGSPSTEPSVEKPVIAAFEDDVTGGRSVTILLTLIELEVYDSGVQGTGFVEELLDNSILWLAP